MTIGSDGYWYIDGVKTEYKAQGEKGEKGDQGETGPQGPQGPKGEDGKDATGIYYYPGTEGAEKGAGYLRNRYRTEPRHVSRG